MSISKEKRSEIINQFKSSENDTGSTEVQCAILTAEINALTEHLKIHKKDFGTRHGLIKKVVKRSKLLKYLKRRSYEQYIELTSKLNIRLKKSDLI